MPKTTGTAATCSAENGSQLTYGRSWIGGTSPVGPGDKVDSAGVRLGKGVLDELADQRAVVRAGPDGQEGLQGEAEGRRVQPHGVAADDAGTTEPVDPVQAGGGGDPGGGGEVAVGSPGVVLQDSQDLTINRIEFNRIDHLPNVARLIIMTAGKWPMMETSGGSVVTRMHDSAARRGRA